MTSMRNVPAEADHPRVNAPRYFGRLLCINFYKYYLEFNTTEQLYPEVIEVCLELPHLSGCYFVMYTLLHSNIYSTPLSIDHLF